MADIVECRELRFPRLLEFKNDGDAARLRAAARWLELNPEARLVGIAVSTDYDGDGVDSLLYITVEQPPPPGRDGS